jgi:predicted RNA-binding Zn ribbon-like protein
MVMVRGEAVDALSDAGAANRWLCDRGFPRVGVTRATLPRIATLRAAIREAFTAEISSTGRPPRDAVKVINEAAASSSPLRLTWSADGPRLAANPPGLDFVLASIATDCIDLLTGDRHRALRHCGAHGCIRFFLQNHGRRQWCSRTCGDRVRVARHHERRRDQRRTPA